MLLRDVETYECWKESPPFQPYVTKYIDSYQETQISWNPYCIKKDALFYEFKTGIEAEDIELISDACLNVLFQLDQSDACAWFSGTYLQPRTLGLKPNTTYFGFKPYSNLGIRSSKVELRDMVDSYVDFSLVFPDVNQLISDMSEAASFNDRTCIFKRYTWDHLVDHGYTPSFVDYLTIILCTSHGSFVLNNMDQMIGYSERYCRKKFKDSYGLSPKQYSDIIRFQTTLKALFSDRYNDLSSLGSDCGYYDQSHLIRNFRQYTNETPGKFLEKYIQC